jgi:hypothetical protein
VLWDAALNGLDLAGTKAGSCDSCQRVILHDSEVLLCTCSLVLRPGEAGPDRTLQSIDWSMSAHLSLARSLVNRRSSHGDLSTMGGTGVNERVEGGRMRAGRIESKSNSSQHEWWRKKEHCQYWSGRTMVETKSAAVV